jgi:hypothetical protein
MSCCSHPSMVLRAGQAPWREQRANEHAASWRASFHRACHWLECACQSSPTLRDEPLLGACLPEVTAQLGHPRTPGPAEAKPRRRFDPRIESEPHKQARCSPAESAVRPAPTCRDGNAVKPATERLAITCRTQPPNVQEKRRADSVLLSRLCPKNGRQPAEGPSLPSTLRALPSCPSPQPPPPPPASLHDWFRNLAEKAERRLQGDENSRIDGFGHRRGSPPRNDVDEHPESHPFTGQTVSESLLLDLVAEPAISNPDSRPPQPVEPQAHDRGQEHQTNSGSLPPKRKPLSGTADHFESNHERAEQAAREASATQQLVNTFPDAPDLPFEALPGTGGLRAPALPSPSDSPSLALRLPLSLGAIATVQHSSRINGVAEQEEDLAILADKIKRILNDEARRFGIDV